MTIIVSAKFAIFRDSDIKIDRNAVVTIDVARNNSQLNEQAKLTTGKQRKTRSERDRHKDAHEWNEKQVKKKT